MAAQGDAGGKAKTMREIPALFNGAMVRAIINDRKTQTRRIVKPHLQQVEAWRTDGHGRFYGVSRLATTGGLGVPETDFIENPLGKPGDRLWVREAHAWVDYLVGSELEDPVCVAFAADNRVFSFAGKKPVQLDTYGWPWDRIKYRPSIHMPRWAARLFLDVLDVRIERLQDISEEDARAEGMDWTRPQYLQPKDDNEQEDPRQVGYPSASDSFARDNFCRLWTNIYGAESWAANPWVWVTQFKRVT